MSCAKLRNEIITAGLLIALLNLDAIIETIRNAADAPTALRSYVILMVFLGRKPDAFCR